MLVRNLTFFRPILIGNARLVSRSFRRKSLRRANNSSEVFSWRTRLFWSWLWPFLPMFRYYPFWSRILYFIFDPQLQLFQLVFIFLHAFINLRKLFLEDTIKEVLKMSLHRIAVIWCNIVIFFLQPSKSHHILLSFFKGLLQNLYLFGLLFKQLF